MNKIYRLKFSKRLNQLIAVSEISKGHDRNSGADVIGFADNSTVYTVGFTTKLKPLALLTALSFGVGIAQPAAANGLVGMDVASGSATMKVEGLNTTITNSPNAIINWKQFNIGKEELVRFVQESANSAVFNRVTSDQISQLQGALKSNGAVFLINPNGIVFGKNAVIDTASFTASTLNISDKDLQAKNFAFEQAKDKAMAEIVNNGLITVNKNGTIALVGGSVKNNGVLKAEEGNIFLLAGQKVTLTDLTNPAITYSLSAPENEAVNLGNVFASKGKIQLQAGKVSNKGVLNADSISTTKSGEIILSATNGTATVGGTVTLNNANFKGGSLKITGDKVVVEQGAKIELTGQQGGTAYIGGDERGQGKIKLAQTTHLQKQARIDASGTEQGGKVILWGDQAQIDGEIKAQGKQGGFVETSGHYLGVSDSAKVNVNGEKGKNNGEWLLDPYNVRIVAGASDSGVTTSGNLNITPTGSPATVSAATIKNALNNGATVHITTNGAGNEAGDIIVEADIIKDQNDNEATLKFTADNNFVQNTGTTIAATVGKLGLNITAGKITELKGAINTNGGDLNIDTKEYIELNGAALTIGGGQALLKVRDILVRGRTANNGQVFLNNSTINVGSGGSLKIHETDFQYVGDMERPNTLNGQYKRVQFTGTNNIISNGGTVEVNAFNNGITQMHQQNTPGRLNSNINGGLIKVADNAVLNLEGNGITFKAKSLVGGEDSAAFDASYNTEINVKNGNVNFDIIGSSPAGGAALDFSTGNPANSQTYGDGKGIHRRVGLYLNKLNLDNAQLSVGNADLDPLDSRNATHGGYGMVFAGDVTQKNSDLTLNIPGEILVLKESNFTGDATSNLNINTSVLNVKKDLNISEYNKVNISDYSKVGRSGMVSQTHENNTLTIGGEGTLNLQNIQKTTLDTENNGNLVVAANVKTNSDFALNSSGDVFIGYGNKDYNQPYEEGTTGLARNNNSIETNGSFTAITAAAGKTIHVDTGASVISDDNATFQGNSEIKGTVESKNENVIFTGGDVDIKDSASVTAKKAITANVTNFTNAGNMTAKEGDVTINATEQVTLGGTVQAEEGSADIDGKNVNVTGAVDAKGDIDIDATEKATVAEGAKVEAKNGDVTLDAVTGIDVAGTVNALVGSTALTTTGDDAVIEVASTGDVSGQTGMTVTSSGDVTNAGKIYSEGAKTTITAEDEISNTGEIKGNTDVEVTGKGDVSLGGTVEAETGKADIDGKNVNVTGAVDAEGNIDIDATEKATVAEGAKVEAKNGDVTLDAVTGIDVAGTVNALVGSTTLTTTGDDAAINVASTGDVSGQTGMTVTSSGDVTNAGKIYSEGAKTTITAEDEISNTGEIKGKTDVEVTGKGDVSLGGTVQAEEGRADIDGKNVNVTGAVDAKGDIDIDATEKATVANNAKVESTEGNVTLDAVTGIDVAGTVNALAGSTTLTTTGDDAAINVASTGDVSGQTGMTVNSSGDVTNAGKIYSEGAKTTITAEDEITNTGTIKGKTDVEVTGKGDVSLGGTVEAETGKADIDGKNVNVTGAVDAEGNIDIDATEKATVAEGAKVEAKNGDVTLDAVTGIDVAGTVNALVGSTTLTTTGDDAAINVASTGDVSGQTGMTVTSSGDVTNAGKIYSEGAKTTITAEDEISNTGEIKGKTDVEVTGKGDVSLGGTVQAEEGRADIDGKNVNVTGAVDAKGDIDIDATEKATVANNAKVESTEGNVTLDAVTGIDVAGTVNALAGSTTLTTTGDDAAINVASTGDVSGQTGMTVNSSGDVTNAGKIYSEGAKTTITAEDEITNTGTIKGKTDVEVAGKGDVSLGGTVEAETGKADIDGKNVNVTGTVNAEGNIDIDATEKATVAEGAKVEAKNGDVTLDAVTGIDVAGTVNALVGSTTLTTTGDDAAINVASTGDVSGQTGMTVTSSGDVTNAGKIYSEGAKTTITAEDEITNTGTIKGKTDVEVTGKGDVSLGGTVQAEEGRADIDGKNVNVTGTVNAEGNIDIDATEKATVAEGAKVEAKNGDVTLDAVTGIDVAGTVNALVGSTTLTTTGDDAAINVASTGDVSGQTGMTVTSSGDVTNAGKIYSEGAKTTITAEDEISNTGEIKGKTDVEVTGKGDVSLGGTVQAEEGRADIDGKNVNVTGAVDAKGDIDIDATEKATVANNAKVESTEGNVTLDAVTGIDVAGTVNALAGSTTLTTTGDDAAINVASTGDVSGQTGMTVTSSGDVTNAGKIYSEGAKTTITAEDEISNTGEITGKTDVEVAGKGDVTLGGTVQAEEGRADIDGKNVNVTGAVDAKGDIDIDATEKATVANNAKVESTEGNVTLDAVTGIDVAGTVNALAGSTTLTTTGDDAAINVASTGDVSGQTGMTVNSSGDVTNEGKIYSEGAKTTITAEDEITNTGEITGKTDVEVAGKGDVSLGGTVQAEEGRADIDGKNVNVTGTVDAKGDIDIDATEKATVANNAKVESTEGNVTLDAVTGIDVAGTVNALVGSTALTTTGDDAAINVASTGDVSGQTGMTVTSSGNVTNAGKIYSEGAKTTITAEDEISNTGEIKGKTDVEVAGKGDVTLGGTVEAEEGRADIDGKNVNVTGAVDAKGDIDIDATEKATVANNAKVESTEGNVTLDAVTGIDVAGTVNALAGSTTLTTTGDDAVIEVASTGDVSGQTGMTVTSSGNVTNAGKIYSEGAKTTITAEDEISNTGEIKGKTDVEVAGKGDVTLGGTVEAEEGRADIDGKNVNVTGAVDAKGDIDIDATEKATVANNAKVESKEGDVTLDAVTGIDVAGTVNALVGSTTLTTTGDDAVIEVASTGDVSGQTGMTVTSSGNVTNAGKIYSEGAKTTITAEEEISNTGEIKGKTDVEVAGKGDVTLGGTVEAEEGRADIDGKNVNVTGTVDAKGDIDIDATEKATVANNAKVESTEGNVTLDAVTGIDVAGTVNALAGSTTLTTTGDDAVIEVASTGDVSGQTGMTVTSSGNVTNAGKIYSEGAKTTITAEDEISNTGEIKGKTDVEVAGKGDVTLGGTVEAEEGRADIDGKNVNVTGAVDAKGDIDIDATEKATVANNAKVESKEGDVTLDAVTGIDVAGTVNALVGSTTLTTTGDDAVIEVASTGDVSGQTGMTVTSSGNVTNAGKIYSEGAKTTITAEDEISNTGEIKGKTDVEVAGKGDVTLGGTVEAEEGRADIDGKNVNVTGAVDAKGDIDIDATEKATVAEGAKVEAKNGDVSLEGATGIDVAGVINAVIGATRMATDPNGQINITETGNVSGQNDVTVIGGDIDNKGTLSSGGTLNITAQDLTNSNVISADGDVRVNVENITQTEPGTITSNTSIRVRATNGVDVVCNSIISPDTNVNGARYSTVDTDGGCLSPSLPKDDLIFAMNEQFNDWTNRDARLTKGADVTLARAGEATVVLHNNGETSPKATALVVANDEICTLELEKEMEYADPALLQSCLNLEEENRRSYQRSVSPVNGKALRTR